MQLEKTKLEDSTCFLWRVVTSENGDMDIIPSLGLKNWPTAIDAAGGGRP